MQRLGEAVYAQASETPTDESAEGGEPPEEEPSDDDTVEGEFREV